MSFEGFLMLLLVVFLNVSVPALPVRKPTVCDHAGLVVFEDSTVRDVLRRFSSCHETPRVQLDGSLATIRIGGALHAYGTEQLLAALGEVVPLSVKRETDTVEIALANRETGIVP